MTDLDQLRALVQGGRLPERAQALGARLLARLTSPVRVAVCGPEPSDRAGVLGLLRDLAEMDCVVFDAPGADFAQADMALWVTRRFDGSEQALWAQAPLLLKDHSFLVCLTEPSGPMEEIAAEAFLALMPLSPQDPTGAARLSRALRDRITGALQADQDHMLVFLDRHKALLAGGALAGTASAGPALAGPVAAADIPDSAAPAPVLLYHDIAGQLRLAAQELQDLPLSGDPADCAALVQACCDLGQSLAERCAEDPSGDAETALFKEDILSASDALVLLSMEQGPDPAIDAVTTVLQMKRDVEARIVA